jgi:branched-chain amino acid transport system substrate-binding protein
MNKSIFKSTIAWLFLVLAAGGAFAASNAEPILIGVSGPLTGPNAQYGIAWKKGFDLALDEINGAGGINGRPLQYVFTDTQNDPKQTVAAAQKYIADPKIVLATGDFSSTSSMAASALYQRAGLVQFGFNNSNPVFTNGGDFIWSNSPSQSNEAPAHAAYVAALGLKKVAVFQLNTDWGKSTGDLTVASLKKNGVEVALIEAYLPDEKDFKPGITKAKAANVDGIVLISYVNDASLLVQQIRGQGVTVPIVSNGSQATADFPKLAGGAAEGVYVSGDFAPDDPRPEVQSFAKKWKAKYNEDLDYFAVHAYDSIKLAAAVIALGGADSKVGIDRAAIRDAFAKVKDVPSVIYGKVTFNAQTRRVDDFLGARLIVKDGKFVVWNGKKP